MAEAFSIRILRVSDCLAEVIQRIQSDRKSTRLNSSHGYISYAVFCLKKKNDKYPLEFIRVIRRVAEQTEPLIQRHGPSINEDILSASLRMLSGVVRGAARIAHDIPLP